MRFQDEKHFEQWSANVKSIKEAGDIKIQDPEQGIPRPLIPVATRPMNKLETKYSEHLNAMLFGKQISAWVYEGMKFRLADKTWYTPDFLVVTFRDFQIHEVKGFKRDDAMVKLKTTAELFPWFRWILVEWKHKQWIYTEI